MKSVFAFAFSLLLTVAASAQNYVYQSGGVTPNHAVRWITNGVVGDGGTAANGFLSSIGVLAQGPAICQQSGPITGPYNQICLGVNLSSAATISLQNYGGATAQNLNFNINGTTYPFPGSGNGDVVGPSISTNGGLPSWNNTTGTLLKDASGTTIPGNYTWSGTQTFGAGVTAASLATPSSNIGGALCATSAGVFLYNSGANCYAGGGTAGGSNTQVQYNDSSNLAGISGVTSNGTAMTFANGDLILINATSGAITLAPVAGALGTVTASLPANNGTITELNLAQTFIAPQAITNTISSASGLTANWTVTTNTGGAGITGGPIAGGYFSTLNTTASSGSAADKIGVIGSCATTVNDASGGGCYGGNTFAAVESGGAINRLVGAEDDIAIYSGSSASYRFGHTVINETSGVLQGSSADAAYVVGNIGATAGAFLNGVYFTNNYGFVPLASTAQVINFDTMTVADVIHAPVLTCTNFINSPGVVLGCNGAMTLGINGSNGGSVTMKGGTSGSSQFGATDIGNPFITNVPNSAGNDPLCYGTGANTLSYATACTASDERIKKNFAPAPGLAATLCMAGVMFDWKDVEQAKREGRQIGLIAQDVQKCASELVSDNGDFSYHLANGEMVTIHDVLVVDYPRITAILINAVHDLNAQVVELKAAQKH